jgi:hypothetical protein
MRVKYWKKYFDIQNTQLIPSINVQVHNDRILTVYYQIIILTLQGHCWIFYVRETMFQYSLFTKPNDLLHVCCCAVPITALNLK